MNRITDAQGRFVFRGVAPGHYTVFAWKDAPRGAPQDPEFRKPFAKQGLSIVVEPSSDQTLELKSVITRK